MYVVIAFAIAILVIVLAWRGVGVPKSDADESIARHPSRLPRPDQPGQRRIIAPDDDPEFLSEIDRKLRGEER